MPHLPAKQSYQTGHLLYTSQENNPTADTDALIAVRNLVNQDLETLYERGVRPSRGLLLTGPPGVGKTHAVGQAASERGLELHLISPGPQAIKRLNDALEFHAQYECLIFIDEMEQVLGSSIAMVGLVKRLLDDDRFQKAFIVGATNHAAAINASLLRAGRLDRHVTLGALSEQQRFQALRALYEEDGGIASETQDMLEQIAAMTPGYVVGDLKSLVSRVRALVNGNQDSTNDVMEMWMDVIHSSPRPAILRNSLTVPKFGGEGWDAVSGNTRAKRELQRAVEWPLRHRQTFIRLNLKRPRGILLHGPPGCAKTTLVRIAAERAGLPLLRLTAADIFSSYVGDSERIIREAFATARAAAPSLLFLDEIDALALRREHTQENDGGSQVQKRVLTTLLTEMDGLSSTNMPPPATNTPSPECAGSLDAVKPSEIALIDDGVLVVAASNRLDVIDEAILRPGRFDVLIRLELPNFEERLDMLRLFTRPLVISDCVDLRLIASQTSGKSGAHLKGMVEQAALAALREGIRYSEKVGASTDQNGQVICVAMRHFEIPRR